MFKFFVAPKVKHNVTSGDSHSPVFSFLVKNIVKKCGLRMFAKVWV